MMIKKVAWLTLASLTAISASTFALNNYYAGLSTAVNFNSLKAYHLVAYPGNPTPPMFPQRFNTNGGGNSYLDFGISAGKVLNFNPRWSAQIGLGFYASKAQTLTGLYSAKGTGDYSSRYSYTLKNRRYMFETHLFYHMKCNLSMIFGFGAGLVHLSTSTLSYTDMSGTPSPYPPASATTSQTHGAFSADAGIAYTLTPHLQLQALVKQVFMGQAIIKVDQGDTSLLKLSQGTVKPWQIGLKLNYMFG